MNNDAVLDPRSEQAVQLALAAQWNEALNINLELIEDYPEDIDTLNRLGRAYTELGNINKAKAAYQKVLTLDQYNSIAANNLKRLSNLKAADAKRIQPIAVHPAMFLEEPGKTKVMSLNDLAMGSVLVTLRTGDTLELNSNNKTVAVLKDGKRIGKIPEEWSEIIARAMEAGSDFVAVIKAVTLGKEPEVSVFVKETKRSPRMHQPIFPTESSNFTPYVREEALGLLSNQGPVQTEADEVVEEIEVKDIPLDNPTFENMEQKEVDEPMVGFEEEEN